MSVDFKDVIDGMGGCNVIHCWYYDFDTAHHCKIFQYLGNPDDDPIMVHPKCLFYGMEVAKHKGRAKE